MDNEASTYRTDHDPDILDRIDPVASDYSVVVLSYVYRMLCRIYAVQVHPGKRVLDRSGHPALTRITI